MKKIKENQMKGFTLVELLAVIVILAIILVIAVPKVMSVIEDAKKATLESSAKMIASAAEKAKVQNTVLGKTEEITCESVAKINDKDYATCSITFEDNTAKVTIEGSGKFEGLYICEGTKIDSKATNEGCGLACQVDEQKETYGATYEVNDIPSCISVIQEMANTAGETELAAAAGTICNGQEVYELDFKGIVNEAINMGLTTQKELLEKKVIKLVGGEEVCMPKKPAKLSTYITKSVKNGNVLGLVQTNAEYNGTTYDAGIRYVGTMNDVKNKVYYNCDDTDGNGISYGNDNYDYASSCEVWRIIGVFDTKSSTNGSTEKRVKIINTNSTFTASWDSSPEDINNGYGINQWGESTYSNGNTYEGADLMQLLNGYYISASGSTCTYCVAFDNGTCSQTCTEETLRNAKMKVLTTTAKGMIENVVWDTYGVKSPEDGVPDSSWASTAYLQEKGISTQYTGKQCNMLKEDGTVNSSCNDTVERTTSWTGLVGLISVSDALYVNGWFQNQNSIIPWIITPTSDDISYGVWGSNDNYIVTGTAHSDTNVLPSVYLKSNIQIIGGDGYIEPYKLSLS